MSNQEKDRLGEKLREVEHAREELFFAKRDKELLAKLREKSGTPAGQNSCPACGAELEALPYAAVCRAGHGVWLTRAHLEEIARRGDASELRALVDRLP